MENIDALVAEVERALYAAIDSDQLDLPTLPEIALEVRSTAEDPDVDVAQLAKVIGRDLGLTARILKVANSPLLRGRSEIDDIHTAVSRMGISFTANLAIGLAMQQMFQATNPVIDGYLREIWRHAAEVASIASVLARQCSDLRADRAMLAGLVHSIGALPILAYAEEHDPRLVEDATLQQVIDRIHGKIGQRILSAWDFPADIVMIPTEYRNFARDVAQADYVDIVMVANLQSRFGTEHPDALHDWEQVSAFARLGLDPGVEDAEMIELSADTLQALEAA